MTPILTDEWDLSICNTNLINNFPKFDSPPTQFVNLASKEIFDTESNCQFNQPNSSNNLTEDLDIIFQPRRNRWSILANRRDVLNKVILRGFKRFFVKLLNPKDDKGPSQSTKFKQNNGEEIAKNASKLGLLNMNPDYSSRKSFEEFVIFLGYAKITKQVRRMFSPDNLAINLMEDILASYSHQKIKLVLQNKTIKAMFEYFADHGKEDFIASLKSSSEMNRSPSFNIDE